MLPILIIIILVVIILVVYTRSSTVYVKSSIDGRTYSVKNNSLQKESADVLARVNSGLIKVKEYVGNIYPRPSYYSNIQRFDPNNTHENIFNIDTTYTLDKGKFMAFCIGPRGSNEPILYDLNTLMYVAIHELAHIASTSIGHNDEFKKNFADLLKIAIKLNLYNYVDYSKYNKEYCGITLTKNILN